MVPADGAADAKGWGPKVMLRWFQTHQLKSLVLVIDGDQAGIKKHLALSIGIRLACHRAPFLDVILVMTQLSIALDKVVNRSQHIIWRDHRALRAEEIDEHIWDGYEIWDLEFDWGLITSYQHPHGALVCPTA